MAHTSSRHIQFEEGLISRQSLCARWQVCEETLKRKERAQLLVPIRLSKRMVRYKMAQVLALENAGLAHRTALEMFRTDKKRTSKERLISRSALAERFECSERTLRRYEQEGLLTAMQLDANDSGEIGYRMAEVIALERRTEGGHQSG